MKKMKSQRKVGFLLAKILDNLTEFEVGIQE